MLIETKPSRSFYEQLIKESAERNHTPSGKLSASILAWPLQWQILKAKGILPKQSEEYVLGKFARGHQVEQFFLERMDGVVSKQVECEYRGAVGVIDALVDTAEYDFPLGIIPHEIKSVANAKFKRIKQTNEADDAHKLQAAFYAIALGKEHYAIDYVAADDFRVITFVYQAFDLKDTIDLIIDTYEQALEKDYIPPFEPRYAWQGNEKYNNYPQYANINNT
jgi:hypothetical protein